MAASSPPPLSPHEGWLSGVHHALHFRPTHWSRNNQVLEATTGELLPGAPAAVAAAGTVRAKATEHGTGRPSGGRRTGPRTLDSPVTDCYSLLNTL